MSLENIRNLDYVILLCNDIETMREFYQSTLGFAADTSAEESDWTQYRIGSGLLCLRPRGRWYDDDTPSAAASVQLSFRLAPRGVDEAHRTLLARNAEILEPPTDQPFGHRTLYFRDPERNIIEIYAEI